jgi:short-subunit dehydrogenase
VNNAGTVTINGKSNLSDLTVAESDKIMKLNAVTPITLTSILHRRKLFLDRARVLNISTLAAY